MTHKVLVVEDDETNRNLLAQLLTGAGYDVRTAADGEQALERLRSDCPDVVLLDLAMPRMNGQEFLARKSQYPEWKCVPVIIMTAYPQKLADVGDAPCAREFVTKPFSPEAMEAAIEAVMAEGGK